jgi:hypothetical protein
MLEISVVDTIVGKIRERLKGLVSEAEVDLHRISLKMGLCWTSKRGHPLVFCGIPQSIPVLTVENYLKWYGLELVMLDGTVEEVGFGELQALADERGTPAYVDHVPDPTLVQALAERRGWELDAVSYEVMVGRWESEVTNPKKYDL